VDDTGIQLNRRRPNKSAGLATSLPGASVAFAPALPAVVDGAKPRCARAAPGLRHRHLSLPPLRRPAADRGGPPRRRAAAGLARAARVRDRVAIRRAVALAPASGRVTAPDTPSRNFFGPTEGPFSRPSAHPLRSASGRARLLLHAGRVVGRAPDSAPPDGHAPSQAVDSDPRGEQSVLAAGEGAKVDDRERAFGPLTLDPRP